MSERLDGATGGGGVDGPCLHVRKERKVEAKEGECERHQV